MTPTRSHAFDFLCGLCILRMVSLHVMQFCGLASAEWWQGVMHWTFFFMAFFFFKAGYFNKGRTNVSLRPHLADRTRRLLVPYVSCALIGNVIYFAFLPQMIHLFKKPIEPLAWEQIWNRGEAFGNGPVWFLLSFFAVYMLVYALDRLPSLARYAAFVVCPFVSYGLYCLGNPLPLGLDNIFIGTFFFLLGRAWRRVMTGLGARDATLLSALLVAFFLVGNAMWHAEHAMASNRFGGNPLLALANISAAFCGLSGLLLAARLPRVPVLGYIGQHSMAYFCLHYPMLYAYKFTHLSYSRSIWGRADDAILLVVIIFCLCTWLVPYFERVPWLSGRPRANQR